MMAIRHKCVEMYFIKTTSDCFRMGFFFIFNWTARWEKRQKERERRWGFLPVSVDTLLPPEPQSTREEETEGQFMDIEILM